jgi:hypothetical protein
VVYWDAELKLRGAAIDAGLPWEELFGGVACRGIYEGTHLGQVVGNLWFDRAAIARQPATRVKATFAAPAQEPVAGRPGEFQPTVVEFADVTGTLFHGLVGGQARLVLADPVRYYLAVNAADVRLDELARHHHYGADLQGLAQAQFVLGSELDPRTGKLVPVGSGRVDVPSGRMLNLPFLVPLLKMVKLQTPDQTLFEEAHAAFRLRGDRIKVEQLDLIGTALSLGGSGELDTAGESVRLEFYLIWSQLLKRWLTTPLGDLTSFASEKLYRLTVTRKPNGEMKYDSDILPLVTDPFKAMADRMKAGYKRVTER